MKKLAVTSPAVRTRLPALAETPNAGLVEVRVLRRSSTLSSRIGVTVLSPRAEAWGAVVPVLY